MKRIHKFNKTRNWEKHHDPRSLILALCGEIGELAQLFCWHKRSEITLSIEMRSAVEREIADILIYLFSLCIKLNVDPEVAVREKLEENEKRFSHPSKI